MALGVTYTSHPYKRFVEDMHMLTQPHITCLFPQCPLLVHEFLHKLALLLGPGGARLCLQLALTLQTILLLLSWDSSTSNQLTKGAHLANISRLTCNCACSDVELYAASVPCRLQTCYTQHYTHATASCICICTYTHVQRAVLKTYT